MLEYIISMNSVEYHTEPFTSPSIMLNLEKNLLLVLCKWSRKILMIYFTPLWLPAFVHIPFYKLSIHKSYWKPSVAMHNFSTIPSLVLDEPMKYRVHLKGKWDTHTHIYLYMYKNAQNERHRHRERPRQINHFFKVKDIRFEYKFLF